MSRNGRCLCGDRGSDHRPDVPVLGRQGRARVRARRRLPARPPDRHQGSRALHPDPLHRQGREGRPADDHAERAAAGGHHEGQRHREGERGRLLPGGRRREGDRAGRELPRGHVADLADHAPQRARPGRPRPAAVRARSDQRPAAGDHRRADPPLGREGLGRRGEGRRAAPEHAARPGPPGRGRARAARQGHRRRGRVRGVRQAGRGRRGHQRRPGCPAAEVPADHERDRRRRSARPP